MATFEFETKDVAEEQADPPIPIENVTENTLPKEGVRPSASKQRSEGRSRSAHLSTFTGLNGETQRDFDFKWNVFIGGSAVAAVAGAVMCLLMSHWIGEVGGLSLGRGPSHDYKGTELNLHVVLMTTFMVYIQGLGTILFRMLPTLKKLTVKRIHAGFHATGLLGVSVGLYSAVNHHNIINFPHFHSLHSWIGIIAISLFYVQFLAGLIVFRVFTPMRKSSVVVPYHHALGSFIFVASCLAAISGMMMKTATIKDYHQKLSGLALTANFAALFLLVFCFTIIYLVTNPRFKRRPRPET